MIDALEVVFDEGKIWHPVFTDDGSGGYTEGVPTSQDALVLVGEVTEFMKREPGYTDKDVGIFILRTAGLTLNSDDQIEDVDGNLYLLGRIVSDPAKAAWEVRGTPKDG
jgi:hypothetical protein